MKHNAEFPQVLITERVVLYLLIHYFAFVLLLVCCAAKLYLFLKELILCDKYWP